MLSILNIIFCFIGIAAGFGIFSVYNNFTNKQGTLIKNESAVLLNIIDEGSGIPDNEKKKIFEKFYRTGNEATRKTQGTGLGLYLCNKIAIDHNADIIVTNNTPSGCNFAITFYL